MTNTITKIAIAATALMSASSAFAAISIGNTGTGVANGSVTAPPTGGAYRYVSTFGGVNGAGQIAGAGGVDGSKFVTDAFTANAGAVLTFYFNYVTSDGAGFSDYAWSALLDSTGTNVADYIFSARTTPTGNTVPGFGLPGLSGVLLPAATPIIAGATTWDKLGSDSGACFQGVGNGCGSTGWIKSTYTIATAGTYTLGFGVTNVIDNAFDSGLAFTGAVVDGTPIDRVPEPGTWAMLIAGFGLVGAAARRRRNAAVAA
jgi:hypothetical protein